DDCYTIPLHNPKPRRTLSVEQRSGKPSAGCYASDLHSVRTHLVRRAGRIYYRRRVPDALRAIVGRTEVWRSLGTDSPTVALRRSHQIAAEIERGFEQARARLGMAVDPALLEGTPPIAAV